MRLPVLMAEMAVISSTDRLKSKDLEVLLDALGMSGLGKHDDAALDVPTNHYLCSRPAVLGTDSGQYWVAE